MGKGEIDLFINKARNEGPAYAVFKVFNILFMIFIIAVTLFPYLNVLAKALNDGQDSMRGGITLWPRKFTWENFRILLGDSSLWLALCVSLRQFHVQYAAGRHCRRSRFHCRLPGTQDCEEAR